jgi:DNA-binding winged helix-turn-helix (wHTH) protein/tetratricopeptide (TPR) repeat protein
MKYIFDNYLLDTNTLELRKNKELVAIEPQVFRLLETLIENRDVVLSKDQLIDLIWHGRPMSDTVVSSRIKVARKAIGDNGNDQKFIKTIHGRGFRFIGEVSTDNDLETLSNSPMQNQQEIPPQKNEDTKPSIIVLPFTSNQLLESHAILPSGFVIDIILGLSRLRWMRVISQATSFQFGSDSKNENIISQTGAKYCLMGYLECSNNTLVLNVELSNIATNDVIWMERLQGKLDEIHELRTSIVNQIVAMLEVQISSTEASRAQLKDPENLDAWSAYHLAMAHLYRFTALDNKKAEALFSSAIAKEPSFARAHAGLSFCHFQNAFNRYPGIDIAVAAIAAKRSAERSVELDPLDAFANFAMGRCFWLIGSPEDSLSWLERSLAVNPNFAQAYYAHGLASLMSNDDSASTGHQDASLAIELSPLDPLLYGFYGVRAWSYIAAGDYEAARFWTNKAARQPGALMMMDVMACIASSLAGYKEEAASWAARAKKRNPKLTSDYFFRALPFNAGSMRDKITLALKAHNL